MSLFVETDAGQLAVSSVVRAVPATDGKVVLHYLDGGGSGATVRATGSAWEWALRRTVGGLVPALPGTYVLHPDLNDNGFEVWQTNVIAWAASADGGLHPVTADGVNDESSMSLPVLHPDGRVDEPYNRSFASVGEWAEEAEARLRSKAKAASGSRT